MSERHSWHKLKVHEYICTKCATGKVNALVGGEWQTTYHLPDATATQKVMRHVPECKPGPRTASRLKGWKLLLTPAAAPVKTPDDDLIVDDPP